MPKKGAALNLRIASSDLLALRALAAARGVTRSSRATGITPARAARNRALHQYGAAPVAESGTPAPRPVALAMDRTAR